MLAQALLVAVGAAMIAATALPLVRAKAWWIRWFDFPRLQILAIGSLVLLASLFFASDSLAYLAFVALLAASLAYQCWMMFPYTKLARAQVELARRPAPEATVCLLFANVLMENRESARLKAMIAQTAPDVVLAVEADQWWGAELAYLKRTHPHAVEHPRDNTYGMLLYSRLELAEPQVRFLVQEDVPSIHARLRLRGGAEVELRCLHPRPPAPQEAAESTERDTELLVVAKDLKRRGAPAIVIGDLNDVAWSRSNYRFLEVSGLLDPRVGRGFFHTFHASYPFLRYPLDHCFHSRHFRLVSFRRLERFGSDHFPVCIALSYEPGEP
ncbi:MAG TPA: endonuclease/exonuclease/phosphatase family protein [Burkholderiales bacterium]|nr:endonuclease/exonuclease/phosphatase family protein [Burkholderiales bacterium]